jgi:hypothetical protein
MSPIPVKISSTHQIVVPQAIWKELNLKAGVDSWRRLEMGSSCWFRNGEALSISFVGSIVRCGRGMSRLFWTRSGMRGSAPNYRRRARIGAIFDFVPSGNRLLLTVSDPAI